MKIVLLSFILLKLSIVYSQSDGVYTSKYWNYRYALRGDDIDPSLPAWEPGFLKVGTGSGFSLPMRYRERLVYRSNGNYSTPDPIPVKDDDWKFDATNKHIPWLRSKNYRDQVGATLRNGILSWHDVPTDLGKYLMVLSTELDLLMRDANMYNVSSLAALELQNFNLTTQLRMTYQELSMAVNAMDRLDRRSDAYWGGAVDNNPDGFFIRDDVPENFADDGKFGRAEQIDDNYWTNTDPNFRYYRGDSWINTLSNNIESWAKRNPLVFCSGGDIATSKDQFVKVMLGVIYARIFTAGYKNKFGDPDNLQERCRQIIHRSISRSFNDFSITTPNGNAVCTGSAMSPYSPMLWDMYVNYGGGPSFLMPWDPEVPAWLFKNTVGNTLVFGQKIYYTTYYPIVALAGAQFPIGNTFSDEIFGYACASADYQTMYIIPNSLSKFGMHLDAYNPKPREYQFNFMLEAIRARLHGGGNSMNFGTPLTVIPASIPAVFVWLSSVSFNWFPLNAYESFLNRPSFQECRHENDWHNTNPQNPRLEEKNGLDYLLMHNLYQLEKPQSLKIDMTNNTAVNTINLYNRRIEGTFPRNITLSKVNNVWKWPPVQNTTQVSFTYGSAASQAFIESAYSIDLQTSPTTYLPNARVFIRTPHPSDIRSTDVQFGATFEVMQERMQCSDYAILNSGGHSIQAKSVSASTVDNKSISLFPNPTLDNTTIRLSNYNNLTLKIGIYDMVGRLVVKEITEEVFNNEDEKDIFLNTESLNRGIYIVKISHGDTYTSLKLEKN